MSEPSVSVEPIKDRPVFNSSGPLQLGLLADVVIRLAIWTGSLAFTLWWGAHSHTLARLGEFNLFDPPQTGQFARRIAAMLIVFNLAYLANLMILRLFIPRPRPGRYPLPRPLFDRNLICTGLLGTLARARYQPPFPAFLDRQLAGIQPFRWMLGLQFGPKTASSFWADPLILDSAEVTIGRNVGIGLGTTLAGHLVAHDWILFAPIIIEDDVLVGGNSVVTGDVHIKRGAVIGMCSYVKPGTVVGENEFWAGVPARKIKDLEPVPTSQPRC